MSNATDTRGFNPVRSFKESGTKEPPWHFIGQLYQSGNHSVVALAQRFKVNERQLRSYLAKHYQIGSKCRSNLEVSQASNQVKDDLVSVLLRASASLRSKETLTKEDVATLEKLVSTSSKLFAWPAVKPIDSTASATSDPSATGGINLGLLRLSPEQIRNANSQ